MNTKDNVIKEFQEVRDWGKIRGMESSDPLVQYMRFQQEGNEILEALLFEDEEEFRDAIGDTIVTLIILAGTKGYNAENCLQEAFDVIKLRKGLNKGGSFVRYQKLDTEEQVICDELQGNPGNQYFEEQNLNKLTAEDFIG